jgi:hypothetical protein
MSEAVPATLPEQLRFQGILGSRSVKSLLQGQSEHPLGGFPEEDEKECTMCDYISNSQGKPVETSSNVSAGGVIGTLQMYRVSVHWPMGYCTDDLLHQ